MKLKVFFICLLPLIFNCKNHSDLKNEGLGQNEFSGLELLTINYTHLNHLYKDVLLPNEKNAAIIHIYSNYPEYTYDVEPKEGFTCVDDVARAIILLSAEKGETERLVKLTEFILHMQNENGWFNNFVRKDLSINTTYKTSIAQADWWSWRALWALEKALPVFQDQHPELEERIDIAIEKIVRNTKVYLSDLHQKEKQVKGISIATNLPYESAADQASILLIGLCNHYQRTRDKGLEKFMKQLADGILKMQIPNGDMKGMFLSWENVWHAYGNSQSYALLLTGKLLDDTSYTEAALKEINSFYPFLNTIGFPELMVLEFKNQTFDNLDKRAFPQIAYGIRPIVYACAEAYRQTRDEKYKEYTKQWLSWFSGNNVASKTMYNSQTGRCFDGIISKKEINKNSGAESTIEALLSIQAYNSIK